MLRRQFGKALITLGFMACLTTGTAFGAGPAPAEATAVVETLHKALLSAMKSAGTTPVADRAARLGPVISSSFALNRMSQFAAGSGWRKMTDQQKSSYLGAFTDITIATYANRFDGFSGESFATLGTEEALNDSLLVRTELRRPRKDPVRLTYVILGSEDGPKIVDIYLDGSISELARQRSEYQSVLRSSGADALISGLQDQAERMLKTNG